VRTVLFRNVDPELLNKQRLELINMIWDKPNNSLWGLVEMLDEWYDRTNPIEEV
jgi:hypothetical protein